ALPALAAYGILVCCMLAGLICSTVFSIFAMTSMQQQTPTEMLGKMAAFVSAIAVCAMPLGQAMYGLLFELFSGQTWLVVVFAAVTGSGLALLTRRALVRFISE
ncbi:MAG: MFS transporter, partial [Pseudoflavonifractor sp.]